MNTQSIIYPFVIAAFTAYGGVAAAQDNGDDLDVTMDLIEEDEAPDSAMEPIELPGTASEQGVESSADGLATANEARERGREFGQDTAEEARQRGEDAREEASDDAEEALSRARQNVKDNVPSGALDNIPENVRDNIPEDVRDRIPGGADDLVENIPETPGDGGDPTGNAP